MQSCGELLQQRAQALIHLWALQHVQKENNVSLLPRNRKRKPIRCSNAAPVRDTSVPPERGNGGDLLLWVPNKRNLKFSISKNSPAEWASASACTRNGDSLTHAKKQVKWTGLKNHLKISPTYIKEWLSSALILILILIQPLCSCSTWEQPNLQTLVTGCVTYQRPAVLLDVSAEPRHGCCPPSCSSSLSQLAGSSPGKAAASQSCLENTFALGFSGGRACTGALTGTWTSPVLSSILSGPWAIMATEQSPPGVHSQPCQAPKQLPGPRHPLGPHSLPRLSFSHPLWHARGRLETAENVFWSGMTEHEIIFI